MKDITLRIKHILLLLILVCSSGFAEIVPRMCGDIWQNWNDMPRNCQDFCSMCLVPPMVSLHQPPEESGGVMAPGGNPSRAYGSGGWCQSLGNGLKKCGRGAAGILVMVVDIVFDDYIPDTLDPFHNAECHASNMACLLEYQDRLRDNLSLPTTPITRETGQGEFSRSGY